MTSTRTLLRPFAFILTGLFAVAATHAADNPLKQTLTDMNAYHANHWIYNDLSAAKAEARRTGKPIFVTFRCVPCNACKSFDAEVANGSDIIRKLAKENFVSLRQVEMKGVDLNLFQFDHDLNWAAMFINADGTIYGRYGTQSADGPDAFNSIESLEKAMQRVLKLHADHPNNKQALAGKRGKDRGYRTALEMPGMLNKDKLRAPTHRGNCIHCHMIHDAENLHAFRAGRMDSDLLWRYPYPNNLGIEIDPDDGRRIESVHKGGSAEKAGLRADDEVMAVNGQPIISIADFQWVLHNLPNTALTVTVTARRNGATSDYKVNTSPGWKKTDFSWRGSLWAMPPRIGIFFPPLKPAELKKAGLSEGTQAVRIKWINKSVATANAATKAGLRLNDIVIELDGKPVPDGHRAVNYYVKQNFRPGQKLPLTVLRNGKRVKLSIPLRE